jgi:hypothetical protein
MTLEALILNDLIELIIEEERDDVWEHVNEHYYHYDTLDEMLSERYDQGFDAGYSECNRIEKVSLSQEDLTRSFGENVISFNEALNDKQWKEYYQ